MSNTIDPALAPSAPAVKHKDPGPKGRTPTFSITTTNFYSLVAPDDDLLAHERVTVCLSKDARFVDICMLPHASYQFT